MTDYMTLSVSLYFLYKAKHKKESFFVQVTTKIPKLEIFWRRKRGAGMMMIMTCVFSQGEYKVSCSSTSWWSSHGAKLANKRSKEKKGNDIHKKSFVNWDLVFVRAEKIDRDNWLVWYGWRENRDHNDDPVNGRTRYIKPFYF